MFCTCGLHRRSLFRLAGGFAAALALPRVQSAEAQTAPPGATLPARGEFVGYVGTATDIHERKQMEDALRESEAGFRDLADTAPVMIWTTDERGLVTFVNAGWLRYTGTTLESQRCPSCARISSAQAVAGMIVKLGAR